MTEEEKKKKREKYNENRRLTRRSGGAKKICGKVVVRMFGLRVIVGTFDKHNPRSIYLDGTINCEGTNDIDALGCVETELGEVFKEWVKNQDFYDRKRNIRIIKALIENDRRRYVGVNKHIKFDVTLIQNRTPNWKESVEIARKNIVALYANIVKTIEKNGLVLKDFAGHHTTTSSGKPCNLQATDQ